MTIITHFQNGDIIRRKSNPDQKYKVIEAGELMVLYESLPFNKSEPVDLFEIDIGSMTKEARIELAYELQSLLFSLANSFAGGEYSNVAIHLHGACNSILFAKQEVEGNPTLSTKLAIGRAYLDSTDGAMAEVGYLSIAAEKMFPKKEDV